VARRLRESVRQADFLARYGGEEFALVVPGASPQELASIGERLRTEVACHPIQVAPDVLISVTVSVGTAGYPPPRQDARRADHHRRPGALRRQVAGPGPGRGGGDHHRGHRGRGQRHHVENSADLLAYLQRAADEVDGWLSSCEHGRAVGRWAALVASALGEDEPFVQRAELAGRLHDVGKVFIPQAIWRKPSALSPI